MSDKLRVLVMDDNENVLKMTALALTKAGFEVFTAGSLLEFDELMNSAEPHIVLSDIMMPEISGDSICRVLKKKMDSHLIPVILFSTIEESELAALAENSGADGYVSKIAGIEVVIQRINELTEEIAF